MKFPVTGRRTVLRFLLALPLTLLFGCKTTVLTSGTEVLMPSPEEALRRLILLVGPWDERQGAQAEDFSRRFLAADHTVSSYLPGSSALVQSLANRFPGDAMAVHEIYLAALPKDERELLLQLSRQIYTYVEVRFFVAGEPPWGECQGDRLGYTRAPKS